MLHEEKFNECYSVAESALPLTTFVFSNDSQPHWHDYMEFLYCRRGKYYVGVGDDKVICEQDELVLINAKEPHATLALEADAQLQVLHIPVSMLYSYLNNDAYFGHYMAFLSGKVKFVRKYVCRQGEISTFFNRLLEEYEEKRSTYELQSVAYVLLILSDLIRNGCICFADMDAYKKEELEKLQPALEYLKENYMRETTLQEIADTIFLSKSAVCKLFRKVLGMSFKEYVNQLRLTEAKKLLVTTSYPITVIATEVGYSNVTYFNRVFRENYKHTPSEFRREYKKNFG